MKSKTVKSIQLRTGLFLLAVVLLSMAVFVLLKPLAVDIDMDRRLEPPSAKYWLGTGGLGRGLLSCVLYGTGISLFTAVTVVLLCAVTGGLLGLAAGYSGGMVDSIIMRIVDILLAFPGILAAIALAAFLQRGLFNLILVLTVTGWVEYARIVRGEVLKYKQKEFILAAKSYNASFSRIIFHHLLPLVLPLLAAQASLGAAGVILAESSLNFLGIGLDPQVPTLGQLIDAGRDHMFDQPMLIAVPGIVLFVIIIAFSFIGEGLRKKFTGAASSFA